MSGDSLVWKKMLSVAFMFEEEFSQKNKANKSKNTESDGGISVVLMISIVKESEEDILKSLLELNTYIYRQ